MRCRLGTGGSFHVVDALGYAVCKRARTGFGILRDATPSLFDRPKAVFDRDIHEQCSAVVN